MRGGIIVAEEDVVEYLQSNEDMERAVITGDDIEAPPACVSCDRQMPDAEYNDNAPESDYIVHVLPGEDDTTPAGKDYYCGVGCFLEEMGVRFSEG